MHEAVKLVRKEELLRLLLTGHMLKECGPFLNLSYATVCTYARDPNFLSQLKEQSTEIYRRVDEELTASKMNILSRLEEASDRALQVMESIMETSKSDMIRVKAAQDIMDRDGRVSRTRRIEGSQAHEFLNPLTLIHAAKTAREVDQYNARELPPASEGEGDGRTA